MLIFSTICYGQTQKEMLEMQDRTPYYSRTDTSHLEVSDAEWKKILPADVYAVAREEATERAFTGKYWDAEKKGTYYCAVCGNKLFKSDYYLLFQLKK